MTIWFTLPYRCIQAGLSRPILAKQIRLQAAEKPLLQFNGQDLAATEHLSQGTTLFEAFFAQKGLQHGRAKMNGGNFSFSNFSDKISAISLLSDSRQI